MLFKVHLNVHSAYGAQLDRKYLTLYDLFGIILVMALLLICCLNISPEVSGFKNGYVGC